MTDAENTKLRVATHEAAHCVAAKLLNFRVDAVCIRPELHALGFCAFSKPKGDGTKPERIDDCRAHMVIAIAALEAEAQILGRNRIEVNGQNDFVETAKLAEQLCGLLADTNVIAGEIETARAEARTLVEKHEQDIRRVADCLLAFDECINIIGVKHEAPETESEENHAT